MSGAIINSELIQTLENTFWSIRALINRNHGIDENLKYDINQLIEIGLKQINES